MQVDLIRGRVLLFDEDALLFIVFFELMINGLLDIKKRAGAVFFLNN